MWAFINLATTSQVPAMLKRAKASPLTVEIPLWRISADDDKGFWKMANRVLFKSRQFEDLWVVSNRAKMFTRLLQEIEEDAPLLRRLRLNGSTGSDVGPPEQWPWANFPSLQSLEIHEIPLPIQFPAAPRLTRLDISNTTSRGAGTFGIRTALSILQNTPMVEELYIDTLCSEPNDVSLTEKIPLAHLKLLEVQADDLTQISLFDRVDFPSTTKVGFQTRRDDLLRLSSVDASQFVSTFETVFSRRANAFGRQGLEATFTLTPNFPSFSFLPVDPTDVGPVSLFFNFVSWERHHTILPAIHTLATAATQLSLVYPQNAPEGTFIEQLLSSHVNVKTVYLQNTSLSFLGLLNPGTPISNSLLVPPSAPILPQLNEIVVIGGEISHRQDLDHITCLINSRPSISVQIRGAIVAIEVKHLLLNEPRVFLANVSYFGGEGLIYD
ncbi:hypothetical protein ONZ45_g9705 [Pleurotus djamor]|nr:hypothetical protein ONZ45_g9705 [Pleurotus djamor]